MGLMMNMDPEVEAMVEKAVDSSSKIDRFI